MKSFTNRLVMFAASAIMLGTMAYGQTTMNAAIPFAFSTANATLPAGNYTVNRPTTATNTMHLYNRDSRRGVFIASLPVDWFNTVQRPVLVFACVERDCTLRAIKTDSGTYNYSDSRKTARAREAVSLIEVPLTKRNAD